MAVRKRRARRTPPRSPRNIERQYTRALRALNADLTAQVERELRRPLIEAAKIEKGERTDAPADAFAAGDWAGLRIRLGRITRRAGRIVDRFGDEIGEFNAGAISRILAIDLAREPAAVTAVLDAWRRENVSLISSLADRLHADVFATVREHTQKGTRVETLGRLIAERYSVSRSRANTIASDQVLKANGDLTRQRHAAAGVTRYAWSTSRDEKVRDMHAALEGRIFSWDDPPVTNERGERNHPGGDILCRCNAIPVLD